MKTGYHVGEASFPPLTPERQALAAEAMDRAKRYTRRYADTIQIGPQVYEPRHRSDVESDANYAAVCAAGMFDPKRGHKSADQQWKLWSARRIDGSCRDLFRRWYWNRCDNEACSQLMKVEPEARRSHVTEIDARDEFEALVRHIPDAKTRRFLCLVYVYGCSLTEAGNEVGLSIKQAGYVHRKSLGRLRSFLEGRARSEARAS